MCRETKKKMAERSKREQVRDLNLEMYKDVDKCLHVFGVLDQSVLI